MHIAHLANCGFRCTYQDSSIRYVTIYYEDNSLLFEDINGNKKTFYMPRNLELSSYNEQFGITLSDNPKCFFVQSWEKGLFCFSLNTGEQLWHVKRKHACNILVDADHVFCYFRGDGIRKYGIVNGDALDRYSFVGEGIVRIVDDALFLLGPKRGSFLLLDKRFDVIRRFRYAELNPCMYYNFILKQAHIENNCLLISGVEYSEADLCKYIKNKCLNRISDDFAFERTVPI